MNCTDSETGKLIGAYELGLLSKDERLLFEDHLLECQYCFQSLYRTAPLANLMRKGNAAPEEEVELFQGADKDANIKSRPKRRPPHHFRRTWISAVAGIAAVAVMAVLISIWIFNPARENVRLRGYDEVPILIVSPIGGIKALSEIRWKAVKGIETYNVKIFSESGDLVWEESSKGNSVVIPASVSDSFVAEQEYYWQVEGQMPEGDLLKSQKIQFWIKR